MLGSVELRPVRLAGYRPVRLGQLVTLNPTISPNIQVQVQTGFEQYLLPVGLMAGGVSAFVLGTALPKNLRPVTTISGLGLVLSGVGVILYRAWQKSKAAAAAAPGQATPAAPPPPSGGIPVTSDVAGAPAFQPPTTDAFNMLQIQVVSPGPDQQVSSSGGFLFFGQKTFPVQLRMFNPSGETVTFNLDFVWDESPGFTGYSRGQYHGTKSFQVTLGPNEEKNQSFDLPIQTDVPWTQIQGALALYKKRTPAENEQLVSNTTFTIV
jgi:hypothetical protein